MGRRALSIALGVLAVLALLWAVLPREPVDVTVSFDPARIGPDLDAHLAEIERGFDDIVPGVQKRIIWAGAPGQVTEDVVVYLHGFSASSEEIRPVPDLVAEALGANLLYWRLPGHGRDSAAMAEPSAGDWIESTAHALAVADRMGARVTVISTSTGGTLAALAAIHPAMKDHVDRIVFVSPNFEIAFAAAQILTWPGARLWGPLIAGEERGFEPINAAQERYWTTRYPTVATIPLGALVNYVRGLDFARATQPALFVFADTDQVVSPEATREVAALWGGPVTLAPQVPGPGDDPSSHVIAGDIVSPGLTKGVVDVILDWEAGL